MNFFRDVVSHLLKNAFEGHTQFSVADNTAVGDNPIRSISLDAVPVNENVIISLAWEGGEKLFEKTLSDKEAQHQFDLISTDLAEVASLTKQGQYDAAKDLMKKLGQKYAENTGELVQTNLPPLHNTQASEDDHLLRQAKITMQNLWFSTTDELLDYQQKQKGATKPGDQDHIPLWDQNKQKAPANDKLAPASLSYEDLEEKKEKEHEDMQNHIDEKIKTELESALQEKAASVFGPDQVELVNVLRKNGRNWDEIKKILVKDFGFDKDSTNIFVDEQRQGSDPTGIEVEPVKEDEKPLTPPEELVSPETHDQLLQDHEDKKKDDKPVEAPTEQNFTPQDVMNIPEDEEIHDESSLANEIARADNDEIHKVADQKCRCGHGENKHTIHGDGSASCIGSKDCNCTKWKKASLKQAAPSDLNPLQEPVEQEPTLPTQDVVPMGKKPLDHEAPQKGDRVFVASDMTDEKAGFEGTFVSTYKSEGRDQYIVETDEGDLLDVDAHRVSKISDNGGAQVAEPSMEPQVEMQKEQEIPVTPKMSDFQSSLDTEALAIKAELDEMLSIVKEADSHVIMPMMYGVDDDSILQYANGSIFADKIKSGQMQDKDWESLIRETGRWMTQVGRQKVSQTFPPEAEWFLDQEQIGKLKSMFNVLPKESSLKVEAGVTWHDIGVQDPPENAVRAQHTSGIGGPIVGLSDKFANVKLDQKIKNDEETCRQYGLSWIQLERGEHPKGVYAIYAEGFGARYGAPAWTLFDANNQPILPKGYKLPDHDKNPNPEPAIDTESSVKTADDWATVGGRIEDFALIARSKGMAAAAQEIKKQYGENAQAVIKGLKVYLAKGADAYYGAKASLKASLEKKASTDYYFTLPASLSKLKKIKGLKIGKGSEGGIVATEGENYVHLNVDDAGMVDSCTRYGGNNPDMILDLLSNVVGEIRDEHEMQEIWYQEAEAEHNKPGHVCDENCDLYEYPDEKQATQDKQAAPPEDPTKTQFKDVKITPKYVPKQEATPATPELDAVLSKMDALQQNLATLASAREQIAAKMQEELAKIDQQGERVQMEAALQESVEKAAILINAVDSKIVQWKDKLFTLQTEEVKYVPKLSQKELLAKIYAKFDGAEKYVKDVLNGMLSLGKNVTEKTLYRWPNKKSSVEKEASILDEMNRINEELMAALQALSSPI